MELSENIFLFSTVMAHLKKLSPANTFSTIFKCNKNLKEILAPSKYLNPKKNKIPLLAETNVTFAKITWYLTELSDVRSWVRCITLKV